MSKNFFQMTYALMLMLPLLGFSPQKAHADAPSPGIANGLYEASDAGVCGLNVINYTMMGKAFQLVDNSLNGMKCAGNGEIPMICSADRSTCHANIITTPVGKKNQTNWSHYVVTKIGDNKFSYVRQDGIKKGDAPEKPDGLPSKATYVRSPPPAAQQPVAYPQAADGGTTSSAR
ncbi:MAG: hypothetical protein ACXWP5_05895 [Bdellovibrionota bacterium]